MELLILLLFSLGVILFIWGALWLLLLMFQTSVWWGLAQIAFLGLPGVLYAVNHWRMARPAFQVWFFGLLIIGGAGLMGLPYLEPNPVTAESTGETRETFQKRQDFLQRKAAREAGLADVSERNEPGEEGAEPDPEELRDSILVPEEVLKMDPELLRTAGEIRRYARAIQLQERKLQVRRENLDRDNAEEVAALQEDTDFLRKRAKELKEAALRFQEMRGQRPTVPGQD